MSEAQERPSRDSVATALDIVGDRWIFLILREVFFEKKTSSPIWKNYRAIAQTLCVFI